MQTNKEFTKEQLYREHGQHIINDGLDGTTRCPRCQFKVLLAIFLFVGLFLIGFYAGSYFTWDKIAHMALAAQGVYFP